jgi:hypothetical protein
MRLRSRVPGSEHWHYDDRPLCQSQVPLESYCPDGRCASRAYARALAILADRSQSREERLFALHVVVHLVGDAHQPLHAADHDDRGGNQVQVLFGRRSRPKPLHTVWDTDFVKQLVRGSSEEAFAATLVAEHRADRAHLEQGDFASWLGESYGFARTAVYGRLPGFACGSAEPGVVWLPPAYVVASEAVVRQRLAQAGFRLAAVLRTTL